MSLRMTKGFWCKGCSHPMMGDDPNQLCGLCQSGERQARAVGQIHDETLLKIAIDALAVIAKDHCAHMQAKRIARRALTRLGVRPG